jgi:hypothetical protein
MDVNRDGPRYYFTEEEYRQLQEKRLCPHLYFIPVMKDRHTIVYIATCTLVYRNRGRPKQYVLEYCVNNYNNCPLIRILRGREQ